MSLLNWPNVSNFDEVKIIKIFLISFCFIMQSSCKPNAMELAPIAEAPPSFAVDHYFRPQRYDDFLIHRLNRFWKELPILRNLPLRYEKNSIFRCYGGIFCDYLTKYAFPSTILMARCRMIRLFSCSSMAKSLLFYSTCPRNIYIIFTDSTLSI